MKKLLALILLSVVFLAACDPKPPETQETRSTPAAAPRRNWSSKPFELAAAKMRGAVTEELAVSRKTLAERDEKVSVFIDAASDPVLLVQSLASRLGVVIGRDAFQGEMLRRFQADVLSGDDIQAELNACAERVRVRWSTTLDGLAEELKAGGSELPKEALGSLKTPSIKFNSIVAQPAIERQLQRAAVLAGSFSLAPALAGVSIKLLSLFFDAGKWFTKWSSIVKAGAEITFTLVLDNLGESALGLREGATAQTKELITATVDSVIAETTPAWMQAVDDVLDQFAKAAGGAR
ncbi:MAG: hypothetical protein IT462_14485 [Planctomycetes bacterium]|nr:hypothetical protein [Planctomycetota bacterium]